MNYLFECCCGEIFECSNHECFSHIAHRLEKQPLLFFTQEKFNKCFGVIKNNNALYINFNTQKVEFSAMPTKDRRIVDINLSFNDINTYSKIVSLFDKINDNLEFY